jgi:L-alanine-DL-glutamate epimerase-like enolase superfamily enzyme
MPLTIADIERIPVRVPFRADARDWLEVEHEALQYLDVFRVRTSDSQIVGYGESLSGYGTRGVSDAAIARVRGATPAEVVMDATIGQGLQMALLDIIGQHSGVPVWQLLGPERLRDRCPISWWSGGLTPMDRIAAEAESAQAAGYLTQKIKARPWNNVVDQVRAVSAVTPPDYRLDLDWNGMLQTRGEAAEVLEALQAYERVGIFESPIRMEDIEGMALLRRRVTRPLAEHWRTAHYRQLIQREAVDGFVIFQGGAAELLRDAAIADAFHKSSWIQVLGNGLTTAFAAHVAAVAPGARWPLVTCLNIYSDDLLAAPLAIAGGAVAVPDGPGLGVTVDREALETLRVRPGLWRQAPPRRLLSVQLAGGVEREYRNARALWSDARNLGWSVVQPAEVRLRVRTDDGSPQFDWAYARAVEQ